MTPHKLFLEIFELSGDDNYRLEELIQLVRDARADFTNVGKEFTLDEFKEYYKRRYANELSNGSKYHVPLLKIIEGDNLDIIEDAAQKKGLI